MPGFGFCEKLHRIALILACFDLCEAISGHFSDFDDFWDSGVAIQTILANSAIPGILTPRIIGGSPQTMGGRVCWTPRVASAVVG